MNQIRKINIKIKAFYFGLINYFKLKWKDALPLRNEVKDLLALANKRFTPLWLLLNELWLWCIWYPSILIRLPFCLIWYLSRPSRLPIFYWWQKHFPSFRKEFFLIIAMCLIYFQYCAFSYVWNHYGYPFFEVHGYLWGIFALIPVMFGLFMKYKKILLLKSLNKFFLVWIGKQIKEYSPLNTAILFIIRWSKEHFTASLMECNFLLKGVLKSGFWFVKIWSIGFFYLLGYKT